MWFVGKHFLNRLADLAQRALPKERAIASEVLHPLLALDEEKPTEPIESADGVEGDHSVREFSPSEPPSLPQAPTNCFARDEIVTRLLDHLDDLASIVLSGAVGIGKTTIALTILYHDRVKVNFGNNCHFIRYNDLANSSESFLERLSGAIGFPPTGNMEEFRPRLVSCPPLLLVLDGVECILDPLVVGSKEIATTIEEISRYRNICLLATSRMAITIPGFRTTEVTTLSGGGAQNVFYNQCALGRSSAIDNLISSLDFHPLSIALLARVACKESWDESRLLHQWDKNRTDVLKLGDNESLAAAVESVLTAPMIRKHGPAVQETLEAIAGFPGGVEEARVGRMFPTIDGVGEAINVLCRFYLVERHDGFVRMPSPFRLHFQRQALSEGDTQGTSYNLSNLLDLGVDRTVITCDRLEGTIGTGTKKRLNAIANDSSMFYLFAEGLRLTFLSPLWYDSSDDHAWRWTRGTTTKSSSYNNNGPQYLSCGRGRS